jgi:hypothetical protein
MSWRKTSNATRARAAAFTEAAAIAAGVATALDVRKRFVEGHAAREIAIALTSLARSEKRAGRV